MKESYIKVSVKGHNINNYLKWLINKKIDILELKILNHNQIILIVKKSSYKTLNKYSKTYKISVIKKYGPLKIKEFIQKNIVILMCICISILLVYVLSHMIFSIDIIYNDKEISELVRKNLEKYDIKKYKFKKKYQYLEQVKKQILKENKNVLEWFEIEESGTKYIIRIVERKKEDNKEGYTYQSIVSSKNAILKNIKAFSGEKNKIINQYVKKDELVINGILTKADGTMIYTKADGLIYGEVWYKVSVEYPLYYQEESITGKSKNVINIYILNKKISLFPYKKYKQFKITSYNAIESNIFPIRIAKEKMYEVNTKEEIYTEESAINKAIEVSKQKMLNSNEKILEFNNVIVIDKENLNSKIKVNLFISTTENITKIVEIQVENKQSDNE
jgi:hypothetical protein